MTDLEITKACAEAMGFASIISRYDNEPFLRFDGGREVYDPLHDDAQAMALVKKFDLYIEPGGLWGVAHALETNRLTAVHRDLNYAICLCVAKMHSA